jgi:hypothetical protein
MQATPAVHCLRRSFKGYYKILWTLDERHDCSHLSQRTSSSRDYLFALVQKQRQGSQQRPFSNVQIKSRVEQQPWPLSVHLWAGTLITPTCRHAIVDIKMGVLIAPQTLSKTHENS